MVVIYKTEDPKEYLECFTSLKEFCKIMGEEFKYNTLSKKDFPFEWRGYSFVEKTLIKTKMKKSI